MNDVRLVFAQTVEGLFVRGLGSSVPSSLRTALKSQGLDLDTKLLPAYSHAQWTTFVTMTAAAMYPHLELSAALTQLGEALVGGFFKGTVGKALAGVVRLLGPRRALLRTRHSFRSGNNYSEAILTQRGECHFEMWMNETGPTRFICQGIVATGLLTAGALSPSVVIESADSRGVTFEIQWSHSTPHISAESRF